MICASESNLIVADQIYDQVKRELSHNGVYFVGTENFKALEATVMNLDKQAVDPKVAGQTHGKSLSGLALMSHPIPKY